MAFYKGISTATHDDFTIEDEGILNWKKSVVIRPVYKSPPHPRVTEGAVVMAEEAN